MGCPGIKINMAAVSVKRSIIILEAELRNKITEKESLGPTVFPQISARALI